MNLETIMNKELMHRCFNAGVTVEQAAYICSCSVDEAKKAFALLHSYIGAP